MLAKNREKMFQEFQLNIATGKREEKKKHDGLGC